MTRKARVWISATLMILVIFNYLVIGIPLYNRAGLLENRIKIMSKHSDDAYIVDILKREETGINRKITILNTATVSLGIIILSWLVYGLIIHKSRRR